MELPGLVCVCVYSIASLTTENPAGATRLRDSVDAARGQIWVEGGRGHFPWTGAWLVSVNVGATNVRGLRSWLDSFE